MFPLIYDEKPKPFTFRSDENVQHWFRTVRISTSLRLYRNDGLHAPIGKALIDTGAPITVFPQKVWENWAPEAIQWLDPADSDSAKVVNVWRGPERSIPARIGRVRISLQADATGKRETIRTRPVTILAKFLTVRSDEWHHTVLGIGGNALSQFFELEIRFRDYEARLWETARPREGNRP